MDLAQRKADERKHNKHHNQRFTEQMKRMHLQVEFKFYL